MSELRSFQREAGLALLVGLGGAGALAVLFQHPEVVSGIVAGGLVGLANLVWLVGTLRHLSPGVGLRVLRAAGTVRYASIGVLLGVVLIVGHVHPVGAIIGYGMFPMAAAAAGWHRLGPTARSG
jgi:hypothetical protein